MAYSTFAQMVESYGAPLLDRLCTRRDDATPINPVLVQSRVLASMEEASGFMDGFFQMVMVVPVVTASPAGIALLRNCCEQIAVSYLVTRRGYLPRSEDETLVIAQDRWRSFLRSVADGQATIPGASAADSAAAGGTAPDPGFYIGSEEVFFPDASKFT